MKLFVNVIEINEDGLVFSLRSFPENSAGNTQAEQLFLDICRETTELSPDQLATCLEQGCAEVPGGGTVQLFHNQ